MLLLGGVLILRAESATAVRSREKKREEEKCCSVKCVKRERDAEAERKVQQLDSPQRWAERVPLLLAWHHLRVMSLLFFWACGGSSIVFCGLLLYLF